ncbi:MAG: hypothetical protein RMJ98_04515 [Myxococcales bacterium]|nr:hypothetical protein [Polyangiaceae bacterium]MDW8248555.1 hypothetical protein [Myxococcales bacterium]
MNLRHLWLGMSAAAVPFLIFACGGGRSDLLFLESAAGGAGASGRAGGAGVGAGGGAGSAGTPSVVCIPGQQVECACPGTPLKGVQVCAKDGKGFEPCQGCPGGQGGEGGNSGPGGSGGGGGAGGTPEDAGADFFDALPFPLPDSGPIGECVGCLQEQCGDAINACYNDPDCIDGIQCAITDCLASSALGGGPGGGSGGPGGLGGLGGGGGLDFACLLSCFNGDPTAVFKAVNAFQCITQTCGDKCGGGIVGDGGGFPLGGLGGGPTPGASPEAVAMQGVRVPSPAEVSGFPRLQQALTPRRLPSSP